MENIAKLFKLINILKRIYLGITLMVGFYSKLYFIQLLLEY